MTRKEKKMATNELFGNVVELCGDIVSVSPPGCDDAYCPGYQDCNQCNPDQN